MWQHGLVRGSLLTRHPFHPRNRSQTAYCTPEFIGAYILRFCLRLMRYNYQVQYIPGKHQVMADKLSRAPVDLPGLEDKLLVEEVEAFLTQATSCLPAMLNRLQKIRDAQKTDEECSLLRSYCLQGWPPYMPHQLLLHPYWENRSRLKIVDDLLLYNDRILIPRSMRLKILVRIHTGFLGLTKCRSRARTPHGGQDSPHKSMRWSPDATQQPRPENHL